MYDLKKKKLFLLDMDGTIYLDETLFDGSLEFLKRIKNMGAKYIFMTNNSSKGVETYIEKMARLGISTKEDDFLTSVDCLMEYLKDAKERKIHLMGTKSLKKQLVDSGFNITDELECDMVVTSYDTELTYDKLNKVCEILSKNKEIPYIATNPDWVCPVSYGFAPDCGSFSFMIEKATGRTPKFIGKPEPDMIYMAMDKFNVTKEETVIIGDRLYTDIKSGVNAGIDSIFVLSGEGTMDDLKDYDFKPTYIFNSVKDILK